MGVFVETGILFSYACIAMLVGMSGTSFAVGVFYASVWFPAEQQGLALGIVSMGNMGNAVAAMTLPYISKTAGFDARASR